MTLKKWWYMFWTTLVIGGLASLLTALLMEGSIMFSDGITNLLYGIIGSFATGLLLSLASQAGFFGYLTVNQLGLTIFRRRDIWGLVQVMLIIVVFADFVYLRYQNFAQPGENWMSFVWLPLSLLIIAIVVGYYKMKKTNRYAFIPAVFFMFVITALEWWPALKGNVLQSMIFMIIPLLACNIWQLNVIHRLTQASPAASPSTTQGKPQVTNKSKSAKKK